MPSSATGSSSLRAAYCATPWFPAHARTRHEGGGGVHKGVGQGGRGKALSPRCDVPASPPPVQSVPWQPSQGKITARGRSAPPPAPRCPVSSRHLTIPTGPCVQLAAWRSTMHNFAKGTVTTNFRGRCVSVYVHVCAMRRPRSVIAAAARESRSSRRAGCFV